MRKNIHINLGNNKSLTIFKPLSLEYGLDENENLQQFVCIFEHNDVINFIGPLYKNQIEDKYCINLDLSTLFKNEKTNILGT